MSRARWAANMTSSKRLGTCRMQSSTVTRAMETSDFRGARGLYAARLQKTRAFVANDRGCSATWPCIRPPPEPAGSASIRAGIGWPETGCRQSGARSASGSRTKARLRHPGMRQGRPARPAGGNFPMKIKKIEVDRRAALGTVRARPKAASTACSSASRASAGRSGRDLGDGIDVPGLVRGRDRRRPVPGRDPQTSTPRRRQLRQAPPRASAGATHSAGAAGSPPSR